MTEILIDSVFNANDEHSYDIVYDSNLKQFFQVQKEFISVEVSREMITDVSDYLLHLRDAAVLGLKPYGIISPDKNFYKTNYPGGVFTFYDEKGEEISVASILVIDKYFGYSENVYESAEKRNPHIRFWSFK